MAFPPIICRQALFYLSSPSFSLCSFSRLPLHPHKTHAASQGELCTQSAAAPITRIYYLLFLFLSARTLVSPLPSQHSSKRVDCHFLEATTLCIVKTHLIQCNKCYLKKKYLLLIHCR